MSARMTTTAYAQGVRNALICGIGVLAFWLSIAGVISLVSDRPIRDSYGPAFAILWGFIIVWFVAAWIYGRQSGGRVILDCGPHPTRKLFLINAVIFLFLGVTGSLAGTSAASMDPGIAGPVFGISFALYWVIMATGRLQMRETGIWQYWSLLRWSRIDTYSWANDCTLLLKTKGALSSLGRGALPVPPEHKEAIEKLLQEHCPIQRPA